jgi:diguanylate cyclase (GGDEF)-like protein
LRGSPILPEYPRLAAPLLAVAFAAAVAAGAWFVSQAGAGRHVPNLVVVLGLVVCLAILIGIFVFSSRQVARLEELALTDSLCGLPNRRALHRDVKRGSESGSEVAIALIDLDGFKTVNDFYGHSVGDQTIKQFSTLLVDICAENGAAYRLGGDEFALVVTGPLAGTILEGICRRLIAQLDLPVIVGDRSIALGASIGLAQGVKSAEAAAISTDLLRKADVAMYAAKSRGKMRVTWFKDDFDRHREMHQVIDTDLRLALTNGELRMHYQPLIDSRTGQVNSVEALIRWERPDGQRIGPDKFIPVAEESGLIEAIGLWVLRQACNDALDWDDIKLSVNASVAQLRNPQFPQQLGQILEETGFPAARLELEITETFLMGDPTVARRNLEMIREFGVAIVLDDYGTGYASIGFLRRFRFEKLKLDRSLIVDAASDEATRTIMASSVAMAKALGMSVTAEGIETEHHAAMARTAGCDQMQGWLYFKAIPADEIAQHLDTPDSAKAALGRTIRASKA